MLDIIKSSLGGGVHGPGGGTFGTSYADFSGNQSIVLPKAWWNFSAENSDLEFQIYVNGAWHGTNKRIQGGHWSDGTNMRVVNTSGSTRRIYYQYWI